MCWAALPLTVAFLPALQLDDECQTGECALEALQLKGGLVEDVDADSSCEDSTGGACMDDVMWAKNEGIRSHPDWYPGLSQGSSRLADLNPLAHVSSTRKPLRERQYEPEARMNPERWERERAELITSSWTSCI